VLEFLTRLFRGEPSGAKAKERLRLVLLSDHLALAPELVESLKTDLLDVISRYVEVDTQHVDVTFEHRENEVAMLANVPIVSVKTPEQRAAFVAKKAVPRPVASTNGTPRSTRPRRKRRRKAAATAAAGAPSPEQRLPEPAPG